MLSFPRSLKMINAGHDDCPQPRRREGLASSVGLLLLGIGASSASAAAGLPSISAQAAQQIQSLLTEKATRTPAQQKISSDLLLGAKRERGDAMFNALPSLRTTLQRATDGRVEVDINAEVTSALLDYVAALGGVVVNSFPQYHAIHARLPLDQIETLAGRTEVHSIRTAIPPITHKTNTSRGDVAHRAAAARTNFGVDGTGVKICVLSDSVDHLATVQGSGDLPAVAVLPGQAGAGSGEGTAMLEIVYDLAPGATLGFATAFNGEASFASNILALNAAGCKVIVDDVFYFAEPVFQDGIIAQAVNTVTSANPSAGGSLYFSSAGNSGNKSDGTSGVWEGDFSATTLPPVLAGAGVAAHNFGGGANSNLITADSPYVFILQWSDPMGASANDYDLFLLNNAGTSVLSSSTNVQNGNDDPLEFINSSSFNDTNARLVIVQKAGAAARYLHLNANRGRFQRSTRGQTAGHATAVNGFGVAAVWASAAGGPGGIFNGTESVETFSSDGPRHVFYYSNGTPITPGNFLNTGGTVRQKPDITAADGVATATPGFNPFFGTSAAAPHAAAIAGLLLSAKPNLTQAEARQVLTNIPLGVALDIEAAGADQDSGFGLIDSYAGLNEVVTGPAPVVCDVDSDLDVDKYDILAVYAARGTAVAPGDPRDPNNDLVVTSADVQICRSLCTRLNCAP